jgi:hypothetical protein
MLSYFLNISLLSSFPHLENNNIICPEQKGFRKGMRTSDHIFTLKTLIDKYFKKNKYIPQYLFRMC